MTLFFRLIFLVAITAVVTSCGSTEKTDDILKLGGISSTGNKDDEDSKERKQDSSAPLNPDEMCKNSLDLSPRTYRSVFIPNPTDCGIDERSSECVIEFRFESLSSFTVIFAGQTEESPLLTFADYKACNQSIMTSIHSLGELKLSDDQKTLSGESLGSVFQLVE